jgi:hypothetical protein
MSQTQTPDGSADHRDLPAEQGSAFRPTRPPGYKRSWSGRRRVLSLVAGSIACVLAVVFVAGGGWALWKDRVNRDSDGFVSIGSATLRTETHAIVGDLHGDGPSWLWESSVLGDSRVRATSQSRQPLFIGIARTDELFRYLRSAGYATIDSFEVRADTTHPGGRPSRPPSDLSIWAASAQGTSQQTLRWDSRAGDWSVVFMNADASAGVAVDGNASAKLPILPWVAGGLLAAAAAFGLVGGWLLVRSLRRDDERTSVPPKSRGSATPRAPVGASS